MLACLLIACKTPIEEAGEQPPNILMFLVDDMGWQDTSVPFWTEETPFNRRYDTPGMERLADEGMLFTQAYASSFCSPTRISLMTGMNAARHRVTNWTLRRNTSQDGTSETLQFPDWNVNGLQPVDSIEHSIHATTLPQLLQKQGYFTIHCGKAHFGAMNTPGADPRNLGFDLNIAGHAAGGLGSYLGTENFGNEEKGGHTLPWGVPGLEQYHGDSIFLTEALTREAIQALDSARQTGKPFYLYMAHYAVHIPLAADWRFVQKYIDQGLPEPEAQYASMLEAMDRSLVDLLDYLDEHDLTNNTVVLFMSDNGGFSLRPRAGELHSHNAPLNSGKGSAYEGGIREPMIVRWPGVVRPGARRNDYLIIENFFPTILDMAGVQDPQTVQAIDTRSFLPMLREENTTATDRDLLWHFPNNWGPTGPGIGTTSSIRSGDWKLVYWYEDGHVDLFNLAEDIGETRNLADKEPERVADLRARLSAFLRGVDAQRPLLKTNGKPAPWPDEAGGGAGFDQPSR